LGAINFLIEKQELIRNKVLKVDDLAENDHGSYCVSFDNITCAQASLGFARDRQDNSLRSW
jgi:hypothetical protein